MVAISKQYPIGANIAVQISQAVCFEKGTKLEYSTQKSEMPSIKQGVKSSLCLALKGPNLLKISILHHVLYTHNWEICLEVLIFKIAIDRHLLPGISPTTLC